MGPLERPFHPALEAWRDIAVLPEVRYHVGIVRKEMRGLRELWIARAVSCRSSGNVTAK